MPSPPSRRPCHRRTRTWAALALWLLIAYPLSTGPLYYAAARDWITEESRAAYTYPADAVMLRSPLRWYWAAWASDWRKRATKHGG